MNNHSAAVIGASGLIGSGLVEFIKYDDAFDRVKLITRRALNFSHHKFEEIIIDFSDYAAFRDAISGCNTVFVAVGTTQAKVKGDKYAYRKVDYDIPVTAARLSEETGVKNFLLVSSVGANSKSKNFYLQLKGEVEDAVIKMNIPSISIFRPSLLLGKRKELRPGEIFAQLISPVLSFFSPSVYKPVQAERVARAMINAAKKEDEGVKIHHYRDIIELSR